MTLIILSIANSLNLLDAIYGHCMEMGEIMIIDRTINRSMYKNHSSSVDGIRERMIERRKLTMKYIKGNCEDKKIKGRLVGMRIVH